MRVLGKGKTALAIKDLYEDIKLYDDSNIDEYNFKSDEDTIVSPGIPPYNDLVKGSKNIFSDYDLFLTKNHFTIWISGTNGKTTTTSMLYHLLKEKGFYCGGNIGLPLAKIKDYSKLILETSSFTLHYTQKAKPNIYILLPITPDHISWHISFSEYEKSKLKPLFLMDENDIALVPYKYKDINTKANLIFYKDVYDLSNIFDIDLHSVNFQEPFLMDAILALGVTNLLFDEVDYEKINSFIQDPHKLEKVDTKDGNIWINDSKATNIDATIQALKSYKGKDINLILGGDDKGVDLTPLFDELKNYNISIFAIGKNTQKLGTLAKKYNLNFQECFELKIAIEKIRGLNNLKKYINLLSPAAASLDQFKSYKHRGEEFKRILFDL